MSRAAVLGLSCCTSYICQYRNSVPLVIARPCSLRSALSTASSGASSLSCSLSTLYQPHKGCSLHLPKRRPRTFPRFSADSQWIQYEFCALTWIRVARFSARLRRRQNVALVNRTWAAMIAWFAHITVHVSVSKIEAWCSSLYGLGTWCKRNSACEVRFLTFWFTTVTEVPCSHFCMIM